MLQGQSCFGNIFTAQGEYRNESIFGKPVFQRIGAVKLCRRACNPARKGAGRLRPAPAPKGAGGYLAAGVGGGVLSGRRRRSAEARISPLCSFTACIRTEVPLGSAAMLRARQKNRRGASARGGSRTACSTVPSARTCGEWRDCAPTIFPFARPQTITNSAARRICGIAHRSVFPGAAGFFLSRMRGETSAGTRICDK